MIKFKSVEPDPTKLFDLIFGTDGEIYLYHYGEFVAVCENFIEVEEEQQRILKSNKKDPVSGILLK